jgi:uncharacterized protein (DUF983 family)
MQDDIPTSDPAAPPAVSAVYAALTGRCPRCGRGELFEGLFTLVPRPACQVCGLNFRFIDSGDGPAVFAILFLGFLILAGALIAEFKFGVPVWAHVLLWGLLTPIAGFALLRGLKAALIASQFRNKAEIGQRDKD